MRYKKTVIGSLVGGATLAALAFALPANATPAPSVAPAPASVTAAVHQATNAAPTTGDGTSTLEAAYAAMDAAGFC
jgi:hypothetical protein